MGRRVSATSRALDEALFDPSGWFAIDPSNARVAGVVVPTLDAGLELLGRGRVASIVGRVRPGISAIDVDVDGIAGHAITEAIAGWCAKQGVWSLVRPSGPVDGRHHVFIALDPQHKQLREHIQTLRELHSVAARSIDLRTVVRPLSSPHRTGACPRALGDLGEALRTLPQADPATRTRRVVKQTGRAPLMPRSHRRMELPTEWANYLRTGVRPEIGGHDHTIKPWGSSWEAITTAWLLRCGHDAATAWQEITQSHRDAMGKAKARGRSWWIQCVWNVAVRDDQAFRPVHRVDPSVAAAVEDARRTLENLQWCYAARRRPALLLVGHHVLDRMERTNTLRVPVPERDLVLDTGISDRATIRQVLRVLNGEMGTLDTTTFDTAHRDSSSFEFELSVSPGVRETLPPSLHTPLPRGLWGTLPRSCHQLWRALNRKGGPQTTTELCTSAGIVESRTDEPSPSQVRTVRGALTALAQAGLVRCDEAGMWSSRDAVTEGAQEEAAGWYGEASKRVEAERAAYRAGADSRWSIARAAALKANRAREQAWWEGLGPGEQVERRAAAARRFRALSVDDQEQMKSVLTDRRRRAGVDEAARHDQWLNSLSAAVLARRAAERAAWFAGLAPPLQVAFAAAWRRHRERYGIGRSTTAVSVRGEVAMVLGPADVRRDAEFMERQAALPGFDRECSTAG